MEDRGKRHLYLKLFFAVLPILLLVISITLGLKGALTTVCARVKTMISLPLVAFRIPRNSSPIVASLTAPELPKKEPQHFAWSIGPYRSVYEPQAYLPTDRAPIR